MRIFIWIVVFWNIFACSEPIKFYSQQGKNQDKWVIEEVFKYKKLGFFVDIGAHDGITYSNTFALEKQLGWRGICVEPNPSVRKKLCKNRTAFIDFSIVDGANQKVKFLFGANMLGGIVAEDTDNNFAIRGNKLSIEGKKGNIQNCSTVTLEQVLNKYNAPKVIDYLSIDVEGAETRILRDFPFDKYTFLAMTIERPTPELNALLFKKGYIFVKNAQFDSFYVHESIPNLKEIKKEGFEQIPKKDR